MIGSGAKREMDNNRNYYKILLENTKSIPSPSENQIELDLKRTFPNEEICNTQTFLNKLKNILLCYSIRNSSVGYCQGMNFIVGRLLILMEDEEKVFWLFVQIMEFLLPLDYYSELLGVMTDTAMINILLRKYLPDLYEFLMENNFGLTVNNFIHKWLVCLFTQAVNENIAYTFFDYFFMEGNIVLIKSCLTFFAILKDILMKLTDFEEIYSIMNEKLLDIKNPSVLIRFLTYRKFEFKIENLTAFRTLLKHSVLENLIKEGILPSPDKLKNKPLKIKKKSLYIKANQCDPKWPCCIYDNSIREILEVLCLKEPKGPYVIDNYYYEKIYNYPKERHNSIDHIAFEKTEITEKDFLCQRQKHICDDKKLIDSSIVMLDENIVKSTSSEGYSKESENQNKKFYESLEKSEDYENVKKLIMKYFNPQPILDEEITINVFEEP